MATAWDTLKLIGLLLIVLSLLGKISNSDCRVANDDEEDFNRISDGFKIKNIVITLNSNDDLLTFKSNTSLSSSMESFSRKLMNPFSSGSSTADADRNTYLAAKGRQPVCASAPYHRPTRLFASAQGILRYPKSLEREIKIKKGYDDLGKPFGQTDSSSTQATQFFPLFEGIVVEADCDEGQNGCKIVAIADNSAVSRDSRLAVGDFILALNNENMRSISSATARLVLKRASLVSTDIT